ncbi:MAG TPA: hypothetical protein VGF16_18245 [Bryobacteraceae bacterium]
MNCPERERLVAAVAEILKQIIQIALRQRTALKSSSYTAYLLDQEFAEAVGEKERRLGALLEHEREHGCA